MWKTFVILTQLLSFCFASSGPKIVAEVDYALQNKELQSCIIETTEHFIQEKGESSDRMPFSASQIYQLCLATVGQGTHNSDETSSTATPRPPRFMTSLSPLTSTSLVQPPTVTLSSVLPDTTVSQTTQDIVTIATTLTTPVQEISVSTIQTSIVTVAPIRPSQMTVTEPSRVVFGPARPPTMSPAHIRQEREKYLKEMKQLNIFMQILAGFTG
jgi:hypothetical protein